MVGKKAKLGLGLGKLLNKIGNKFRKFGKREASPPANLRQVVKTPVNNVKTVVKKPFGKVKNAFTGIKNKFTGFFKKFF